MHIKTLPNAIELEKIVIGAMFMDIDAIGKVFEILEPDDFYLEQHKRICQVIHDLYEKGRPIDMMIVMEELKKQGILELAGGSAYFGELAESAVSSANVEHYAEIIKEKSILREIINSANTMIENAYKEKFEIEELLDRAESSIFKIRRKGKMRDVKRIKEYLPEIFNIIDKRHKERTVITGIPSGFARLDDCTAGFQNGEMIVIAGRPSTGKTALALNIATHIALEKEIPVLFFSLEMHYEQLLYRMISSESGVSSSSIRTGFFKDEQFKDISLAIARLNKAPIWIDSTPGISAFEFRAKARRMKEEENIGIVFVDYLQLVSGPKSENRTQEVSYISRAIKGLAMELNIPVIAISQLSRAPKDKITKKGEEPEPVLSDLRESGQIEQDADVVVLLHRERGEEEKESDIVKIKVNIAKNRNGPVDRFELAFIKNILKFREIAELKGE
uniref:Replicative DNA helicase n=1 Tax=candidate division WOR-3 bacterium TaxID=2052148 RepID=A0A7C4YGM6_UNCW3